jgi:hypothetical protein
MENQKGLFGQTVELVKDKDKKKGVITISNLEHDDNSEESLKDFREKNIPCPKIKGFSVGFWGHNEGSGSPCKDEEEVKKQVAYLKERYSPKYKLEIKDERVLTENQENINKEKDTYEDVNKDSDWNEINEMIKRCEKEDEPYYYAFVRYNCKNDLNGKEEWISISESLNRRRNELGSMSGCGGWVTFKTEEDKEKFKEQLINIRKSVCEKPYAKRNNDLFLTDIKIENTNVSFSKKAKEYLERNGFSVEEFYKEFNSLKQFPATKEDIAKSRTFELMDKQADKLKNECWAIKGYFENVDFLPKARNKSDYHKNRLIELNIDFSDLNKLRDLYIQKAKMYQIFYKKIYFQRWGKQTEEEYSLP